ncbi:hypothetical protein E4U15_006679 [Claviceps sp. LM218 group G6]|nr:hypothetical protein E4U15_006679 [Claviceps sp. LM218 group G6]
MGKTGDDLTRRRDDKIEREEAAVKRQDGLGESRTLSWWLVEMELSFGAGAVDRDRRRNGARGGCGRCGGALSIAYPALSSQQTKRLAQYDAACQPPIAATVAAQTFRHIVAPAAIRSEALEKVVVVVPNKISTRTCATTHQVHLQWHVYDVAVAKSNHLRRITSTGGTIACQWKNGT